MKTLELARKGKTQWSRFAYREAKSEERGSFDANELVRYQLLLELQYDWHTSDEELVRFLFEQEILARENDSFQGIGEALWLSAFLLAKVCKPNDISLFWRAKQANFDTHCGFDIEFVFWPLKNETESFLEKEHPEIHAILSERYDGDVILESIETWFKAREKSHPSCAEDEPPLGLYERCLVFGDIEKAKEHLEHWAANESDLDRKSSTLKYAYKEVKEFDKAIAIVQKEIEKKPPGREKAGALRDLLETYILAGSPARALQCVEDIDDEFKRFEDWKQIGLGHISAKAAFDFSMACEDLESASCAFNYANAWAKEIKSLPLAALESAFLAAQKCGLDSEERKYAKLAAQERKRIDALF